LYSGIAIEAREKNEAPAMFAPHCAGNARYDSHQSDGDEEDSRTGCIRAQMIELAEFLAIYWRDKTAAALEQAKAKKGLARAFYKVQCLSTRQIIDRAGCNQAPRRPVSLPCKAERHQAGHRTGSI
jgi:hypothetical protein